MKDLRKNLFGYNQQEVDELVQYLEDDNALLRRELDKQSQTIEQLRAQLRKFRSEEDLIREAIIDAKQLSKRLVREAKEQATEMLFDAEKTISDQFTQFDTTMETLNGLKDKVVAQKVELTKELQETLDRYKAAIENSETEDFDQLKEDLESNLARSEQLAETSKQIILLPNFADKEGKVAVELGSDSKDIPVYSFK